MRKRTRRRGTAHVDAVAVGYTTAHVPGALPNGTRVEKVKGDEGDTHAVGARATVIGSMQAPPNVPAIGIGYFVEWDDMPGVPVFVAGWKLGALEASQ